MNATQGGIIVIDGPDGTGKATTTRLVLEMLNASQSLGGKKFLSASFPNYREYFGQLVRNYLDGDSADEIVRVPAKIRDNPLLASWPYAADRYETYHEVMRPQIEKGTWFLLDRYICSNLAHQGAKIDDEDERHKFGLKTMLLEHGYLGLPEANLTIILNLPEEIRRARVIARRAQVADNRGQVGQADIHEQNDAYMTAVAAEYLQLAEANSWIVVGCTAGDVELTPEQVATKVYETIVEWIT
ncbi:MAG TPA: hypothetical protein VMQ44_03745 [Candidatus Saccharimonadales bacterium]|nr:hypothetical protein [Candidatus Saccharimonadales bacterium]